MSETFDKLWAKRTKDRGDVRVCFDRALLYELEELEGRLADAKRDADGMLGSQVPELTTQRDELRRKAKDSSTRFVFESIGRRRWRDLMAEHPPTDEQIQEAKKYDQDLDFNPETFPAAAMAAACVEPGISVEQAQEMMDELPEGVGNRIWVACLRANVTGGRDPFDLGSETQTPIADKSPPPSSSESPSPSS
jgi:hypothetical protein